MLITGIIVITARIATAADLSAAAEEAIAEAASMAGVERAASNGVSPSTRSPRKIGNDHRAISAASIVTLFCLAL